MKSVESGPPTRGEVDRQARERCTWVGNFGAALALVAMPTVTAILPLLNQAGVIPGGIFWGAGSLALGIYGAGLYFAFRHHRKRGPVVLGVPGLLLVLGSLARVLPEKVGWGAAALLTAAWIWNQQLHHQRKSDVFGGRPVE